MSRLNENRPHGSSAPHMHEDSRSDDLRALYLNARSFFSLGDHRLRLFDQSR